MPRNLTDLTCLIMLFPSSLIEMLLRSTRKWVNNINEVLSTFRDNLFAFISIHSPFVVASAKRRNFNLSEHLCISLIYREKYLDIIDRTPE